MSKAAEKNIIQEAIKRGISADRIIFAPRMQASKDHLKRLQLADLFLDTSPYNAHTTTTDALRMGLPLLTLAGKSFSSRVAASLLHACGLDELITHTNEQYEQVAIALGNNPEKFNILRNALIKNFDKSPLMQTKRFTHYLEYAFKETLRKQINNTSAESFNIPETTS